MNINISELQNRYLRDIENIITENSKKSVPKKILALSGGTDSVLLLAVIRSVWPNETLYTFTIAGEETTDLTNSMYAADFFGTEHQTISVSLDTLFENLHLIENKGYKRVSEAMAHIFFDLSFNVIDINGSKIFSGFGADTLYGTWPKIYKKAQELANKENCSLDEARIRLKERYFLTKRLESGTKEIFKQLVKQFGGNPILPYMDERLIYINQLPYELSNPDADKQFVKDAMKKRFNWDITRTSRMGLQKGTGLKEKFQDKLLCEYGRFGQNSEEIITKLSAI
jgi:asparagine synthetase B (glutamine-hydrolysing)